MTKDDPWLLDQEEHKNLQNENKGKAGGTFCPKRNTTLDGDCKVCDEVSRLFNTGEKRDKEIAFQKMSKASFYFNIVLSSNINKGMILEMGKKAGNSILDGINQQNWVDIAHPIANKGREMMITKKQGDAGYPAYQPSPNLEKADWSVPEDVLKARPNLDNIIDILKEGSSDIYKISDLKMDETLRFRILPPWENKDGNKRVAAVVWRHYGGVTQDEVDGKVNMDLSLPQTHKSQDTTKSTSSDTAVWDSNDDESKVSKEKCFGMVNCYDSEDEVCMKCSDFKSCGREVMNKS